MAFLKSYSTALGAGAYLLHNYCQYKLFALGQPRFNCSPNLTLDTSKENPQELDLVDGTSPYCVIIKST